MNLFLTTKLNSLNLVIYIDINAIFGWSLSSPLLWFFFDFSYRTLCGPVVTYWLIKLKKRKEKREIRCPCQTEMHLSLWWWTLGFNLYTLWWQITFFFLKNPPKQLKTPRTLEPFNWHTVVLCLCLITEICAPRHSPKERLDTQQEVSNSPQINTQSGKAAVLKKCLTETSSTKPWVGTAPPIRRGPAAHSRCLSSLYQGLAALLLPNGLLLSLINENVSLPVASWGHTQLARFVAAVHVSGAGDAYANERVWKAKHWADAGVCVSPLWAGLMWGGAQVDHLSGESDACRWAGGGGVTRGRNDNVTLFCHDYISVFMLHSMLNTYASASVS